MLEEASVMGLGGGDVDPNSQTNFWPSSGDDHLWNLGQARPGTGWEAEIEHLLKQRVSPPVRKERRSLYDRVQEIEGEEVPVVFLLNPNLLVGAKDRLRHFAPAILDPNPLWNSEQLHIQDRTGVVR
jgi:peptide/nickel transport system substrate-binding protein